MSNSQTVLLIIENDPSDVLIFKRVLKDINYNLPVAFISDGNKALRYFENPDNLKPWLIFLDLNMPSISGRELLAKIKLDQRFKWMPVVILSSSENPDDVITCMNQGACGYLRKEFEYGTFKQSIHLAIQYWAMNLTPATLKKILLYAEEGKGEL